MLYALIKTLHILSAIVLFGTGLGTAYFMWRASRTGDAGVIASVSRHVVQADWFFTTPTVILQPLTGVTLMYLAGMPFSDWLIWSVALYVLAGMCWLPVVWLQLRLARIAGDAHAGNLPLPDLYHGYARIWFLLGIPAFTAMIAIVFLMVFKPV